MFTNKLTFISSTPTPTQTLTHTYTCINLPSRWISLPLRRTLHSRGHIPFPSPEQTKRKKKQSVLCFDQQAAAFSFLFPLNFMFFMFSSTHSHDIISLLTRTYKHSLTHTDSHEEFLLDFHYCFVFCLQFFVGKNSLKIWIWLAISIDRDADRTHSLKMYVTYNDKRIKEEETKKLKLREQQQLKKIKHISTKLKYELKVTYKRNGVESFSFDWSM